MQKLKHLFFMLAFLTISSAAFSQTYVVVNVNTASEYHLTLDFSGTSYSVLVPQGTGSVTVTVDPSTAHTLISIHGDEYKGPPTMGGGYSHSLSMGNYFFPPNFDAKTQIVTSSTTSGAITYVVNIS